MVIVSDGVGLEEPSEHRGVHAGFVVVEPGFGDPGLSCIEEPCAGGRGERAARDLRDPELVVGEDARGIACAVAQRDDRAKPVGVQERERRSSG